MEALKSDALKWANMYYLEHCRVLVNGGQVEYATDEAKRSLYWNIPIANTTTVLPGTGRVTKQLYQLVANATRYSNFVRSKRGNCGDTANQFLDHGNYLAYGLAASATWVLGLPHSLAVLHGKTGRVGLVFDVADLVKDALIIPQAFISAIRGDSEQEFRQACIEGLTHSESLDFMIDTLKGVALKRGRIAEEKPAA